MAHAEAHHHHIIPKKVLFTVFGVLVTLTVLTAVTAHYFDLGGFNVPLALAIAFTKASLVLAIFMALKYDNRVNTLVFSIGAVFVGVFLLITLLDTAMRGSLGMMEAGVIEEPALPSASSHQPPPSPTSTETEAVPAPTPAAADTLDGAALFTTYLCNTCHSLDGTKLVGPSLQGVGSRLTREEVVQSIREPDAVVAEGFTPGIMSATMTATGFEDKISDEEFEALVDYLRAQE